MKARHDIRNWNPSIYEVHTDTGRDTIIVSGRDRWALEQLIGAETTGCTPIDNPAPRWSAYVHNLSGMGVEIETIHEKHNGPFPGAHARYVLRSEVTRRIGEGEAA